MQHFCIAWCRLFCCYHMAVTLAYLCCMHECIICRVAPACLHIVWLFQCLQCRLLTNRLALESHDVVVNGVMEEDDKLQDIMLKAYWAAVSDWVQHEVEPLPFGTVRSRLQDCIRNMDQNISSCACCSTQRVYAVAGLCWICGGVNDFCTACNKLFFCTPVFHLDQPNLSGSAHFFHPNLPNCVTMLQLASNVIQSTWPSTAAIPLGFMQAGCLLACMSQPAS